jgi:hypothetical protein
MTRISSTQLGKDISVSWWKNGHILGVEPHELDWLVGARALPESPHILRRVCHGCILTRFWLINQHVMYSPLFPLCREEVEDDFHISFTCSRVQGCRDAVGLRSILHSRL